MRASQRAGDKALDVDGIKRVLQFVQVVILRVVDALFNQALQQIAAEQTTARPSHSTTPSGFRVAFAVVTFLVFVLPLVVVLVAERGGFARLQHGIRQEREHARRRRRAEPPAGGRARARVRASPASATTGSPRTTTAPSAGALRSDARRRQRRDGDFDVEGALPSPWNPTQHRIAASRAVAALGRPSSPSRAPRSPASGGAGLAASIATSASARVRQPRQDGHERRDGLGCSAPPRRPAATTSGNTGAI